MDFGRVDPKELDHIDFTLPPDHPLTAKFLGAFNKKGKPEVFVGCAKWGRPDWVGKLYPKGTKAGDYLKHYVRHFNCIELNATFYRIFDPSTIEAWKKTAPEGFKFCPKFPEVISHRLRLKNASALTEEFFDGISRLEDRLGHLFLQLSDNFTPKSLADLLHYLEAVHRKFPIALELRSKSWFTDIPEARTLFSKMHDLGISTVITDAAGRRDCVHQVLTTETAFIRYVGNSLHPTDYQRIDSWAQRIQSWLDKGLKRVYFFIHNHDELYSPELARYSIEKFNSVCGLNLEVPQLLNEAEQRLF